MGVAGSLNLNELLTAQSTEPAIKNASAKYAARYAHLSDGERHELLGLVKVCVEEDAGFVNTRK